ncbi:MAG: 5'-nucleotidase C-terminal domain-containing protein [Anaerolineae bacterium]|nr:5'-nucleotidase C-terminal domain-containing protein [Anaerolineae bacterium]
MRYITIILLVLIFTMPIVAQDGAYQLTIFHTDNALDENEADDGIGGVAKQATIINEARTSSANVLLLDGGDRYINPTHFEGNAQIMNALGYDAMTLGNHEFNGRNEGVANFLNLIDFPMIAANIDFSASPILADRIPPYIVIERSGEQIGIIGLGNETAPILSSPGTDLIFLEDETQVVQAMVAELESMGINKIIIIAHREALENTVLASAVSGVDVIVGGSDNVLLSNSVADAPQPYPMVTESLSGDPVLVVQTSEGNDFLGHLDMVFDAEGVLTAWSGDNIFMDESIVPDANIEALVSEIVTTQAGVVLGEAEVYLIGGDPCRETECILGNLITDAIRAEMFVDIAVYNSGGIRADIDAGEITEAEVVAVLPFGNIVSTMELTGVDVMAMLEHGVSLGGDATVRGSGRFLQISGLRYTWNPTRPMGNRIVFVEVMDADGHFVPLDLDAIYSVATNDFIRNGGDDFVMLAENAIDPFDFGAPVDLVVADYIRNNTPLAPELEGRITRIES